jgi:hypothetical protein
MHGSFAAQSTLSCSTEGKGEFARRGGTLIVHWSGWGWTAFYIPIALLFAVFGFVIFAGVYEPDPHKSDQLLDLVIALWMLLSAAAIFAVDRWREGKARWVAAESVGPFIKTRRNDTFLWITLSFWPYVFLVIALGAVVASFFA